MFGLALGNNRLFATGHIKAATVVGLIYVYALLLT